MELSLVGNQKGSHIQNTEKLWSWIWERIKSFWLLLLCSIISVNSLKTKIISPSTTWLMGSNSIWLLIAGSWTFPHYKSMILISMRKGVSNTSCLLITNGESSLSDTLPKIKLLILILSQLQPLLFRLSLKIKEVSMSPMIRP